jgi:hypothetical protein
MSQVLIIAEVYQYNDSMKELLPFIILLFVAAPTSSKVEDGTSLA